MPFSKETAERFLIERLIEDQKILQDDLSSEKRAETEPAICKQFGCGKRLTMRERLFGDKCIQHSASEGGENYLIIKRA